MLSLGGDTRCLLFLLLIYPPTISFTFETTVVLTRTLRKKIERFSQLFHALGVYVWNVSFHRGTCL